jgi:hypothetical protein
MNRQDYDHSKLEGQDASIETSLKEYGLAWIETDDEYLIYYGIKTDDNADEYTRFDFSTISKDIDIKKEYSWVNEWEGVMAFSGIDDMSKVDVITQIDALLSYYGFENVFGSTYHEGITYTEIVLNDVLLEVEKFNENDDKKMEVKGDDWFTLHIDNVEITEGDEEDILKRVKQINRENGYSFL